MATQYASNLVGTIVELGLARIKGGERGLAEKWEPTEEREQVGAAMLTGPASSGKRKGARRGKGYRPRAGLFGRGKLRTALSRSF